MEKKLVTWVDPPSGWRYGFPKPLPAEVPDFHAWLVSEGYPRSQIEALGDNFWCRQWYEEITDYTKKS